MPYGLLKISFSYLKISSCSIWTLCSLVATLSGWNLARAFFWALASSPGARMYWSLGTIPRALKSPVVLFWYRWNKALTLIPTSLRMATRCYYCCCWASYDIIRYRISNIYLRNMIYYYTLWVY